MYRSCLPNLKSQNSLFLGLGGWWGGDLAREFPLKGVQCFGMHEISSFTIKLWNFMWLPSISPVKIWNPPIATTIAKWMFHVPGMKIIVVFLISWQNGISGASQLLCTLDEASLTTRYKKASNWNKQMDLLVWKIYRLPKTNISHLKRCHPPKKYRLTSNHPFSSGANC